MLRDDFADLEAPREKGKPRPFKLKVFFITLLIAGAALSPSAYLYFKAGGSLNPLGLYQFVFESGNEIKRTKQWMQKGEWHKARDIIRYYYTMEADNANYLALGALINYKMGRYQEAMDLAQALVELDPERAEGHALVGACAIHFTRFAEARAASQKALQLDSYLALPYITMGNLYLKGGQADRALTLLKQAGRLNPQDAETWTLLSSVYLKQDDLENAMLAAQTALEIEPDSPGGHFNLGRVYFKKGDAFNSVQHMQRAEDLYAAREEAIWMGQARQKKELMIKFFKLRPEDILRPQKPTTK